MLGVCSLVLLVTAGCGDSPSILDPKGPHAEEVADLSWLIFGLGALVFVLVMAVLVAALMRGSRARAESRAPESGRRFIFLGGIVLPVLILVPLMVVSVRTGIAINDAGDGEALVIEIVGWQFWWEARYPDLEIVTANEIHIPTGRPVELRLTSVDVIHSFWVPQIAGKLDLIPGQTNTMVIQADEAGFYRSHCAEFCGIQHALMAFHMVAESSEDFDNWVELMQQPAEPPQDELALRGQTIFMANHCSACHGIQGGGAAGGSAPDLTHLMNRRFIAAGTLLNNEANLVDFITNAQEIKTGTSMPSFDELDDESIEALIAFLETLQ